MSKSLEQTWAERQARAVMNVWAARGFPDVEAWAELQGGEWTVQSNLINGAPRGSEPESLGNRLMGADQ